MYLSRASHTSDQARSRDSVQEGASIGAGPIYPLAKIENSSDLVHVFWGGSINFYFLFSFCVFIIISVFKSGRGASLPLATSLRAY